MFIQVTLRINDLKIFINSDKISEIYPLDGEEGARIYLDFSADNEQQYTEVKEIPLKIMEML